MIWRENLDPQISPGRPSRWASMTPQQKRMARGRHEAYRQRHAERLKAQKRAHYAANKDKYLTLERDRQYRLRYGITLADYDRMLAEQGGKCLICERGKSGSKNQAFAVDHDHKTGAVRGLLCIKCNSALGWYEVHSAAAAKYLRSVADGET